MLANDRKIVADLRKFYKNQCYSGEQKNLPMYQSFLKSTFNKEDKRKFALFCKEEKIILCAILQAPNLMIEFLSNPSIMELPNQNVLESVSIALALMNDPNPLLITFCQTFLLCNMTKIMDRNQFQERKKIEELESIIKQQKNTIYLLSLRVRNLERELEEQRRSVPDFEPMYDDLNEKINVLDEKFNRHSHRYWRRGGDHPLTSPPQL